MARRDSKEATSGEAIADRGELEKPGSGRRAAATNGASSTTSPRLAGRGKGRTAGGAIWVWRAAATSGCRTGVTARPVDLRTDGMSGLLGVADFLRVGFFQGAEDPLERFHDTPAAKPARQAVPARLQPPARNPERLATQTGRRRWRAPTGPGCRSSGAASGTRPPAPTPGRACSPDPATSAGRSGRCRCIPAGCRHTAPSGGSVGRTGPLTRNSSGRVKPSVTRQPPRSAAPSSNVARSRNARIRSSVEPVGAALMSCLFGVVGVRRRPAWPFDSLSLS